MKKMKKANVCRKYTPLFAKRSLHDVFLLGTKLKPMQEMQNRRNLQRIYCTFESSSTGEDNLCRSPSTGSISNNGSAFSLLDRESSSSDSQEIVNPSPLIDLCSTHDIDILKYQLRELESAMMGSTSENSDIEHWQLLEMISRGELKEVLLICAKAISNDDLWTAEWLITELQKMVSVSGEPIQRLGAYMLEGLVARLSSSGISIYRALKCNEPTGRELLSYMQLLYEVCPYFKFGYMSANGAIADALKNEDKIHIIDFQIAQGSQWVSLIQALAARPGGPPHVRITGLDDSTNRYARGGGLNIVGERLSNLAKACNLPFEFRAAELSFGSELMLQNLVLHPEEAVAVNLPFLMHHIPDESVGPENHRDTLLRHIKSWSPKVVTLVEYELNTNTNPFYPRFLETLNYYLAIFESINVTLPKDHKERINVEQHCLAREIVNIIACEDAERIERHERHGKWKSRFLMAGFRPYPLSPLVNATIRTLLQKYSTSYGLEERDGALYLGWMNRVLVTSCAWQ